MVEQDLRDQVFLAREVLVKRSLTDADVGDNLIQPDPAKSVAIETGTGCFDQFLSGNSSHDGLLLVRKYRVFP